MTFIYVDPTALQKELLSALGVAEALVSVVPGGAVAVDVMKKAEPLVASPLFPEAIAFFEHLIGLQQSAPVTADKSFAALAPQALAAMNISAKLASTESTAAAGQA